ncbi:feruloyl-CoA synthase [Oryzibacter oryziterrae]|uniref:feruloyl-CoA synthase n=1 Tax=Oryzibacter oryziterrae TaxID=2766474 RepID=UPI001F3584DE|nr:feruloyl-CoA synthase [Oryzibacter oryziterrae]
MTPDFHDVDLGQFDAAMEHRADGSIIVRPRQDLGPYGRAVTDRLDVWAERTPDATFLAQRVKLQGGFGDWRRVSYGQTRALVRRLASALLRRGLGPDRPLAILSGNEIEHGLLGLAAMYAGIPYAPISPAYTLVATDFEKIRSIIERLTPGLVYGSDLSAHAAGILDAVPADVELVGREGTVAGRTATLWDDLIAEPEDAAAVDAANAAIGSATIAKILFTSGSTGKPKGVINTHGMMCANMKMIAHHWFPFVLERPQVLIDWLPWNHTFGGNKNFGLVLYTGGSLYIDDGKPTPRGILETVRNLRDVSPTLYFNVPKGFEEIIPYLRADPELRKTFFKDLRITFYAGASLPRHISDDLDALAVETTGKRYLMVSGLGATETAPSAMGANKRLARPGQLGLPMPGTALKLVPTAGKLEIRVSGPNVMPGYWRDPEQTAKSFDEEGFYKLGDAVKFVDEADVNAGFVFDGRISEDFKLMTGTWVSVGPLRAKIVAAFAPLVKDAVIAGHDRERVTALLLPDMAACRALLPREAAGLSDAAVLADFIVHNAFAARLAHLATESTGSSNRVERIVLLAEPPSIDANEITDKGSINQRAVLARRAHLVEALYATNPPPEVITL